MAGQAEKQKGGRKKIAHYWDQYKKLKDGQKLKCKHCGLEFSGSGTRIKAHLLGVKNKGVQICKPEIIKYFLECDETRNLEDSNNLCSGVVTNDQAHEEIMHSLNMLERPILSKVGPFSVLKEVDTYDTLLIDYVFHSSLPKSQPIFRSINFYLTRSDFTTLAPQHYLDSLVIDIFVEHMTNIERRKKSEFQNWYLPLTTFSNCALYHGSSVKDFVERHKIKENYMSNLKNCDKMFIPVYIGENSCGHFYLYVIHRRNGEIEIWDSLPDITDKKKRDENTQKLLAALDKLFEDDIGGKERAFTNFHVAMAKDTPKQPNGYDCGIFVIKFMQQSTDVIGHPQVKFDSDQERLDLALQLLKSDINEEQLPLIRRQNGTEDRHSSGIKRKDHIAVSEDIQRRTSEPFNDSSSGKRLKCIDSLGDAIENLDNSNCPKGHTKGLPLPTSSYLLVDLIKYETEKLLKWLMNDEASMIGVCGMGGVGKTTLAAHIHNQLLERDYGFDHVIWVTVSHDYSILRMQKEIAKSIDVDISGEVTENKVAARLLYAFKRMKKCVIILDDMRHHIFLEQVGVPVLDDGIKLILTTRLLEVCNSMNCEEKYIIKLKPSWYLSGALFKKILVGDHGVLPLELDFVARDVCFKCGDLPLAIVGVATSMKGKKVVGEWRHLLENLQDFVRGQIDLKRWVLPKLRSSYDHLIDNKVQQCFLYCAILTSKELECYDGRKDVICGNEDGLISYFVYEGFIDGMKSRVAQIDEGRSTLKYLCDCNLLHKAWEIICMINYLVRGMAFSIAAQENHGYMIIRHDQEWSEDVQKVSLLMDKDIQEIPFGTSPRCPRLSTLLFQGNSSLRLIADDFFINMPALRVLDLSYSTAIERLPTSVSNLECLVALLLSDCRSLSYVPPLAKLRRLTWLNLSYSGVTELPPGLELAISLRSLDLRGTRGLKMSTSTIAKLINLQSLYLPSNPESVDVKAKDLQGLKKLEAVSAHFCDIEEYNDYVRSLRDRGLPLTSYSLTLGTKTDPQFYDDFPFNDYGDFEKLVNFVSLESEDSPALLPKDIDRLVIRKCHQWICLCKVLSFGEDMLKISRCEIWHCDKLEYLFCCLPSCRVCASLRLGELILVQLHCLRVLCEEDTMEAAIQFMNHLTGFEMYECNRIKRLSELLSVQLQHLRSIEVENCDSVEEIFSVRKSEQLQDIDSAHVQIITLPKLEKVSLRGLPKLKSVFKGIMACNSLKSFSIFNCLNLEGEPIIYPPFKIWVEFESESESYSG